MEREPVYAEGRFDLENFIPEIRQYPAKIKDYSKEKIKVFALSAAASLLKAFQDDEKYDVHLHSEGDGYEPKREQPDILLVTDSVEWEPRYLTEEIKSLLPSFKFVAFVSTYFLLYHGTDEEKNICWADCVIIDPIIHKQLSEKNIVSANMAVACNAKFDWIFNGTRNKELPAAWEKLQGKKTVFWGGAYGIRPMHPAVKVVANAMGKPFIVDNWNHTFDIYARTLFDYAREHPNLGLIVRPHPTLLWQLKSQRLWNDSDLSRFKAYCEQTPNVVWDEEPNYLPAYSVADAVITDADCGIIISAMPLDVPILACYRPSCEREHHLENYLKNLYQAHNAEELTAFLDMVRAGKDPKKELREAARKKYVPHFDGKNGERIKEIIEKKFFERMGLA